MSYLYRSVNAVISPELMRELELGPGRARACSPAPISSRSPRSSFPPECCSTGMGRVASSRCCWRWAGRGDLRSRWRTSLSGLVVARALIGAGVAVCLMAPLKGVATWVPRERQASVAGWIMTAGSLGALAATTPTEFALRYVNWRALFVALALLTFAGRGVDLVARARHDGGPPATPAPDRSGRACATCSRIRASGGSRRCSPPAWARSSRSRGSGRCPG